MITISLRSNQHRRIQHFFCCLVWVLVLLSQGQAASIEASYVRLLARGLHPYDVLGFSVDWAGDVNGDGRQDLIIGTSDNSGGHNTGRAYVLFGPVRKQLALNDLGDAGFVVRGASAGDFTGRSVASAGDVNGDGLDDVMIGAPWADHNSRLNSGSAYIVLGRSSSSPVWLNNLSQDGYRIDGVAEHDYAGSSVAAAGDVNNDGLDDVLMGAPLASAKGRAHSGEAFLLFGRERVESLDLRDLSSRTGIRIQGRSSQRMTGWSVSSAGDVNGDDFDDVIVGAPATYFPKRGSAEVVFGGPRPTDIDLARLGKEGFQIRGPSLNDQFGLAVGAAGDIDGDGLSDLVIGAPRADGGGREEAGSAFIIFGSTDVATADASILRRGGFRVDGARRGDGLGYSVSGVRDQNGDGRDELVLGAPDARRQEGAAYVVYGRASHTRMNAGRLFARGYPVRLDDATAGSRFGYSVSGRTEFEGRFCPSVAVGAPGTSQGRRARAGSVYVSCHQTERTLESGGTH